jgi:hypothetical protein
MIAGADGCGSRESHSAINGQAVKLSLQTEQRGVIEIEAAYELAERTFARFGPPCLIPHIEIEHG